MTTPFKSGYAFGLGVSTAKGRKVIAHGGGIEGFNAQLAYYPESKVTVVVLANANGSKFGELAEQLAAVNFGETVTLPAERKEVEVAIPVMQRYVGVYQLRPGFDLAITLEGDQLMSQATGQGRVPIFAEAETKFFLKVVDAQLEFFTDANGTVTHVVLHQGGRDLKGPRKP